MPEDLVGEAFPVFRDALDGYDPSLGVDFVGYASQKLFWGLEHQARPMARAALELSDGTYEGLPAVEGEEDRLLTRVLIDDLLSRLHQSDAELLTRYVEGHTCDELALWTGASPAAIRKRLERLRRKLRDLANPPR